MQKRTIFKKLEDGSLNVLDFDNSDKTILDYLDESKLVGKGAVGKVYLVDNKYVIKTVSPCLAREDSPLYKYCKDILDEGITTIPGGNDKIRYTMPNLLSEITLGMILGDVFPNSFTSTLASYIIEEDKDDIDVYIVMEALNSFVSDQKLKYDLDTRSFLSMVFQVSHALLQSQQKYRFTHYDLHIENILWKPSRKSVRYPLPNTDLNLFLASPFLIQISDLALARMETQNYIITPLVDTYPEKSYGEFSPGYDILCFLGSLLIDNKYRKAFKDFFAKRPDLHRFMFMFLLWILKDKEIKISSNLSQTRDEIGRKYYHKIRDDKFTFRPQREGDFLKYYKTRSMVSIVNFLSNILLQRNYAFTLTGNLKTYKKYEDVYPYIQSGEMEIGRYIRARSYHIKTVSPPGYYNFTIDQKQLDNCPLQEQYITAVFVDRNYKDYYEFNLDCCKLDTTNYLLEKNKVGFVVNGGFFNIKEDFLPIGIYRDRYSEIDENPVPEKYRDVFGHLVLKNNELKIYDYGQTVPSDAQVFTTGPRLIKNGKVVFDPNQVRFTCSDEKTSKKDILEISEDTITLSGYYKYKSVPDNNGFYCMKEFVPFPQTYARCDRIKPGELSHADNPNPRTVFCILSNGDYIFLTTEGRAKRGYGVDLYQLSASILKTFPNVVDAINLDGGRSSNISWRSVNEPGKVFISNTDRTYVYPVGNLLSLTEK